jgi:hypothetical protein
MLVGAKLRRTREILGLRLRDVDLASRRIAKRHSCDKFIVNITRLSEIENDAKVPTIWRMYSLCAIYRLNVIDMLEWYRIDFGSIASDARLVEISRSHPINFLVADQGEVTLPLKIDSGIDLTKTNYVSRSVQRWGRLPLALLNGIDLKTHRYGYIGSADWRMFPVLHPGAFVIIDESQRKIVNWTHESSRPIYFLEHREGFLCSWCNVERKQLVVLAHPASRCPPLVFSYPRDIEVVGMVTGVAMTFHRGLPSNS